MAAKRTKGFWVIMIMGKLLLLILIVGQMMAFIDYEFTVSIGLQESKDIIGEMGITVRKSCWGLGIGGFLMGFLIEWAKETRTIRKINLRVRSDNENAIQLYKKHGFKEEGMLARDFFIAGKFYDSISMGLLID